MEEKGDQQSLKQKPPLIPRLILTCCMEEDITDMGYDTMDILMAHTTGENRLDTTKKNIKE